MKKNPPKSTVYHILKRLDVSAKGLTVTELVKSIRYRTRDDIMKNLKNLEKDGTVVKTEQTRSNGPVWLAKKILKKTKK